MSRLTKVYTVCMYGTLAAMLLVAGCEQQNGPRPTIGPAKVTAGYSTLNVTHDDVRMVTCWSVGNVGNATLSCIPDWMLIGPRGGARP